MTRPVTLLVVPYDAGHRNARMGAGPLALIEGGLVEHLLAAGIETRQVSVELDENAWRTELRTGFALHRRIKEAALADVERGSLPVLLSGNCNAFLGVIAAHQAAGSQPGVLWLDAHADFHTPASDTFGSLDCQGLSMLTGRSWKALLSASSGLKRVDDRAVALIGARSIDEAEQVALSNSGIQTLTVDDAAAPARRGRLLRELGATTNSVHIHIDADVLDPSIAPANDYAVDSGLDASTLRDFIADALTELRLASLSVASYDPRLDTHGALKRVLTDTIAQSVTTGT